MKKQWNISLLVMFVLVACSLLGLLTVHFLKNMSTQYSQIVSYYKSYYLAKAGMETALTQLQHRWLGFSETVDSSSHLVSENIHQSQSSFSFSVLGKSSFLSMSLLDSGTCAHPFVVWSGQTLVVPLFIDWFVGSLSDSLIQTPDLQNLWTLLSQLVPVYTSAPGPVNLWLLLSDGNGLYPNGMYFSQLTTWTKEWFKQFSSAATSALGALDDVKLNTWQSHKAFTPYLVIANKDRLSAKFCLRLPDGQALPTQHYLIQSFGTYGSTTLNLEATYKQPMPSFLVDSSFTE